MFVPIKIHIQYAMLQGMVLWASLGTISAFGMHDGRLLRPNDTTNNTQVSVERKEKAEHESDPIQSFGMIFSALGGAQSGTSYSLQKMVAGNSLSGKHTNLQKIIAAYVGMQLETETVHQGHWLNPFGETGLRAFAVLKNGSVVTASNTIALRDPYNLKKTAIVLPKKYDLCVQNVTELSGNRLLVNYLAEDNYCTLPSLDLWDLNDLKKGPKTVIKSRYDDKDKKFEHLSMRGHIIHECPSGNIFIASHNFGTVECFVPPSPQYCVINKAFEKELFGGDIRGGLRDAIILNDGSSLLYSSVGCFNPNHALVVRYDDVRNLSKEYHILGAKKMETLKLDDSLQYLNLNTTDGNKRYFFDTKKNELLYYDLECLKGQRVIESILLDNRTMVALVEVDRDKQVWIVDLNDLKVVEKLDVEKGHNRLKKINDHLFCFSNEEKSSLSVCCLTSNALRAMIQK